MLTHACLWLYRAVGLSAGWPFWSLSTFLFWPEGVRPGSLHLGAFPYHAVGVVWVRPCGPLVLFRAFGRAPGPWARGCLSLPCGRCFLRLSPRQSVRFASPLSPGGWGGSLGLSLPCLDRSVFQASFIGLGRMGSFGGTCPETREGPCGSLTHSLVWAPVRVSGVRWGRHASLLGRYACATVRGAGYDHSSVYHPTVPVRHTPPLRAWTNEVLSLSDHRK